MFDEIEVYEYDYLNDIKCIRPIHYTLKKIFLQDTDTKHTLTISLIF